MSAADGVVELTVEFILSHKITTNKPKNPTIKSVSL